MAGRLDENWAPIRDSSWLGGHADGWERGPYWLDGIIPLAHITRDKNLLVKVGRWIDELLARQLPDGWMGPDHGDPDGPAENEGRDVWPRALVLKAFLQHYDATGDDRILPAMLRLCEAIARVIRSGPLQSWALYRAFDLSLPVYTLHDLTGEAWLLDLASDINSAAYPWRHHAIDVPSEKVTQHAIDQWREDAGLQLPEPVMLTHGVNVAMALKSMAVEWLFTGEDLLKDEFRSLVDTVDRHHGLPNGLYSADEHLAGTHPSQGTETCSVVEQMFSLEVVLRVWGLDEELVARLERIAFNALPAASDAEDTAHQYDQQPNQVTCGIIPDPIYSNNGPDANVFGLEPHFGCCTANRHQGWPKFISSLWAVDSRDETLTALSYAPARIRHTTPDGAALEIHVAGDYPFSNTVLITVTADRPTRQPLRLRIPGWAHNPTLAAPGGSISPVVPGSSVFVDENWGPSPRQLRLTLPVHISREDRSDGTTTITGGPLVYVYPIPERWEAITSHGWMQDYAVHPREPWPIAIHEDSIPNGPTALESRTDQASPFHRTTPRITVPVRVSPISNWPLEHGAASRPPRIPQTSGTARPAALIPYGAARLRLTSLPVLRPDDETAR